jgi:excisionase family DNA binding protein
MSIQSRGLGWEAPLRELYSPREVEYMLSISHAQLYRLLGAGRLAAIKIGRSSYIPRASIEKFLAELPAAKVRRATEGAA